MSSAPVNIPREVRDATFDLLAEYGMALDQEGNVLVAHPGLGTVWGFSKFGVPVYQVKSCRGESTTNMAYGGDDMKSLYIVDSRAHHILVARMPVAGKRMYSHADA